MIIIQSSQNIFEAVNKAYEFLCSKSAKRTEGPDPHRIVLLLKTQSILFKRYGEGKTSSLSEYITCSRLSVHLCKP